MRRARHLRPSPLRPPLCLPVQSEGGDGAGGGGGDGGGGGGGGRGREEEELETATWAARVRVWRQVAT